MKKNFLQRLNTGISYAFGWYNWDVNREVRSRNTFQIGQPKKAHEDISSYDRKKLVALSRYLSLNLGLGTATIEDMARYTVGTGFRPQAQTQDQNWNTQAELFFQNWARNCDCGHGFTFNQLLRQWCKAIDRDGEIFIVMTQDESGFPKLQTLESDSLSSETHDAKNIYDGIEFTKTGCPIRFILEDGNELPASSVIHLYEPKRYGQVRGIPSLSHSITDLLDFRDMLSFEKTGMKLNAAVAMAITSQADGDGVDFLGQSQTDTSGLTLESIIGGGLVPHLRPGEQLQAHAFNRPGAGFQVILEYFTRSLAQGMGLPYEFVWDPGRINGTAQRFVLAKAQRRFEERQLLLIESVCFKVWNYAIARAMNLGKLPFNPDWTSVRWQTPPSITVDVGRESAAAIEEIKMGMRTLADYYGEQGMDWQEQLRQIAKEQAYIKQLADQNALPMEMIQQRFPNQNGEPSQPEPKQLIQPDLDFS